MRLKKSRAAAEDELVSLINDGYALLSWLQSDYVSKQQSGGFEPSKDILEYQNRVNAWGERVQAALFNIFPTPLEVNEFLHPPPSGLRVLDSEIDRVWD